MVEEDGALLGQVSLRDLLLTRGGVHVETVMKHPFVTLRPEDDQELAAQVALTAFIPMLMDTGGNCGSQSSVTVIRGLSLGQVQFSDWLRVVWKEIQVSALCAGALACVNFMRLLVMSRVGMGIAATVSMTLVLTVITSDLIGCALPIAAKRLGFDPAVMASPLITTVVDATSLLTYFWLASWMLGI